MKIIVNAKGDSHTGQWLGSANPLMNYRTGGWNEIFSRATPGQKDAKNEKPTRATELNFILSFNTPHYSA